VELKGKSSNDSRGTGLFGFYRRNSIDEKERGKSNIPRHANPPTTPKSRSVAPSPKSKSKALPTTPKSRSVALSTAQRLHFGGTTPTNSATSSLDEADAVDNGKLYVFLYWWHNSMGVFISFVYNFFI